MATVTVKTAGETATVTYTPPATTTTTVLPGWLRTAANTGLAAVGVTTSMLTAYKGSMSVTGRLYRQRIDLGSNQLTLNAGAVLEQCEIHSTRVGSQGSIRLVGKGQKLINCDIFLEADLSKGGEQMGVYADAADGVQIRSVRTTGGSIGIWLDSVNAEKAGYTPAPSTISEWMLTGQVIGGAHHDGFTRRAGNTPVLIDSSWIFAGPPPSNPGGSATTGAIFTQPTWGGLAGNVTVTNSYLGGYGYVVGLDRGNAGAYRNNRFDPKEYGPTSLVCTPPWSWLENYRYDASKSDSKGAAIADPLKK